jgi:hypothetical protein
MVEEIMLPCLEKCKDAGQEPDVVDDPNFLMEKIDADIPTMVQKRKGSFGRQNAVGNCVGIEAKIERSHPGAGAQNAKINRQSPDAIGHQLNHLGTVTNPAHPQGLGHAIDHIVERLPVY